MPENLYTSTHKASTPEYREGWDKTFGKQKVGKIYPFACNPFDVGAARILFDNKNYGIVQVTTAKAGKQE